MKRHPEMRAWGRVLKRCQERADFRSYQELDAGRFLSVADERKRRGWRGGQSPESLLTQQTKEFIVVCRGCGAAKGL